MASSKTKSRRLGIKTFDPCLILVPLQVITFLPTFLCWWLKVCINYYITWNELCWGLYLNLFFGFYFGMTGLNKNQGKIDEIGQHETHCQHKYIAGDLRLIYLERQYITTWKILSDRCNLSQTTVFENKTVTRNFHERAYWFILLKVFWRSIISHQRHE